MRVVLIVGGRGLRPVWINQARNELGVSDGQLDLMLVTWHPPADPLPVDVHWVVGPAKRRAMHQHDASAPIPRPAAGQVNGTPDVGTPTPATNEQGSTPVPAVDDVPDVSLGAGDDLPPNPFGDTSEPEATGISARSTPSSQVSRGLGPIYSPTRLRKAAAWRLRRLRRAVRRFSRGTVGRRGLLGLVYRMRNLPRVQRLRANMVATRFAVALTRDAQIRKAAQDAIVVVATDGNSHRAAWLLARRVPGPEVVIGLPAARRILQTHLQ
jgi:hypothetical protein